MIEVIEVVLTIPNVDVWCEVCGLPAAYCANTYDIDETDPAAWEDLCPLCALNTAVDWGCELIRLEDKPGGQAAQDEGEGRERVASIPCSLRYEE